MKSTSDQLLPRSMLTLDEHASRTGTRSFDLRDEVLDGFGCADDGGRPVLREFAMLTGAGSVLQDDKEPFKRDGLFQKVIRAVANRLNRDFNVGVPGHHDY